MSKSKNKNKQVRKENHVEKNKDNMKNSVEEEIGKVVAPPILPPAVPVDPIPEGLTNGEKVELAESEDLLVKEAETKKAKEVVLTEKKNIAAAERELRRYVRRSGGLRMGIGKLDKHRADQLMKRLGRTEAKWDLTIDMSLIE